MITDQLLHVAFPKLGNSATQALQHATHDATCMQLDSLKDLALLVLERNKLCNDRATDGAKSMQQHHSNSKNEIALVKSLCTSDSLGIQAERSWRTKAESRIEKRLKGLIDLPLSKQDAEIYRRLIQADMKMGGYIQ